jgi:hypothetical protein
VFTDGIETPPRTALKLGRTRGEPRHVVERRRRSADAAGRLEDLELLGHPEQHRRHRADLLEVVVLVPPECELVRERELRRRDREELASAALDVLDRTQFLRERHELLGELDATEWCAFAHLDRTETAGRDDARSIGRYCCLRREPRRPSRDGHARSRCCWHLGIRLDLRDREFGGLCLDDRCSRLWLRGILWIRRVGVTRIVGCGLVFGGERLDGLGLDSESREALVEFGEECLLGFRTPGQGLFDAGLVLGRCLQGCGQVCRRGVCRDDFTVLDGDLHVRRETGADGLELVEEPAKRIGLDSLEILGH